MIQKILSRSQRLLQQPNMEILTDEDENEGEDDDDEAVDDQ